MVSSYRTTVAATGRDPQDSGSVRAHESLVRLGGEGEAGKRRLLGGRDPGVEP